MDTVVTVVAIAALAAVVLAFWYQLAWRERAVPGYVTEEMLDELAEGYVPDPRSLEERIRDARNAVR